MLISTIKKKNSVLRQHIMQYVLTINVILTYIVEQIMFPYCVLTDKNKVKIVELTSDV